MDRPPNDVYLSLIIPAYNESAGIRQAIDEADEALTRLGKSFEILVVDDGSSDATAEEVRRASEHRPWIRLLRHESNRGYGAALRTGFAAARGGRIAFTDADCQFYLDDLGSLLDLSETHDIATGYRADRQDSARRRFFSWGYNLLIRALLKTGVRDCDCALKVFRREVLNRILPESQGFFVNAEMLTAARGKGFSVAEIPVRHRPRLKGESKVRFTDIPRTLATLIPFWWTRVLFPGGVSRVCAAANAACGFAFAPSVGGRERETASLPSLLLLLVASFLFFTRLDCPLLEPEESRYAEIPRQMLVEGSFITPVLNGEPYLQKPPLFYWLVMASYQVFGVHDWSARLAPCAAGFLLVFVLYFWSKRAFGTGTALAIALVLCFSFRFVYQARMVILDGLLCLCVTAALAAGHLAMQDRRRRWWLLSALCCGFGILTKGPIALVLVVVPLLGYQLLDTRIVRLSLRRWLLYLTVATLVAAPWYVAMVISHPTAMIDFVWTHNVLRFFDPVDHSKPVWFFLPLLAMGALPWAVLMLPAFREKSLVARTSALGFAWLGMLCPVLFFSLSECKRPAYILPAFPMLAVVAGVFLHGRLSQATWLWAGTRVRLRYMGAATACFLVAVFAISEWLPDYHRKFGLRGQVKTHAELASDPQLEVVSYPRSWDSIGFYLKRSDVRSFTPKEREELFKSLSANSKTLLFVKTENALADLLKGLPRDLQFVPRGRQGRLTAGLVVPKSALER